MRHPAAVRAVKADKAAAPSDVGRQTMDRSARRHRDFAGGRREILLPDPGAPTALFAPRRLKTSDLANRRNVRANHIATIGQAEQGQALGVESVKGVTLAFSRPSRAHGDYVGSKTRDAIV